MKAGELYRALSSESYWSKKPKTVRWLTARYYAGVDTIEQLWATTQSRPVTASFSMAPELSETDVREIIRLR